MSKSNRSDDAHLIVPGKRQPLVSRLRASFLTGVVVAAPIGITFVLVTMFVRYVDSVVVPLLDRLPARIQPETYLPFTIPGLGVVVAIIGLTLLGMLTRNLFGRSILKFGERIVDRMPVVRTIYGTLKQIFETVFASNAMSFQDVALIEYPRKGVFAIAFITTDGKGEIQARTDSDVVCVFLPTTPNPTSGFLLFVDREELIDLDMTVEEAAKMVISAGIVTPPFDASKLEETTRQAPPAVALEPLEPVGER
ncbi:MAG: DUF502 domain-containing protein [Pseudomonadota bacterium]